MTNLDIVQDALKKVEGLLAVYPRSSALESIIDQLNYLCDIENGIASSDKIASLNFDVIAARNVEDMDRGVADTLYKVFDLYRANE